MASHYHHNQLLKSLLHLLFIFMEKENLHGFSISAPIASIPKRVKDTKVTTGATSQPRVSTRAKGKKKI